MKKNVAFFLAAIIILLPSCKMGTQADSKPDTSLILWRYLKVTIFQTPIAQLANYCTGGRFSLIKLRWIGLFESFSSNFTPL